MKVIAEIGSNFKSLTDCLESVRLAKDFGAGAVKFQHFSDQDLYGRCVPNIKGCLPDFYLGSIEKEAKAAGVEFMCTAFSPGGYHLVDPLVRCHKIASSEITALDILDTVNLFKKPVLLSTGGATLLEISIALEHLRDCDVTIMHCVTDYPARVVDFRHMDRLRKVFGDGFKYGYSDHSCDVLNVPYLARSHGAVVIEKHVNFTDHKDTPDAPHSLSGSEFALMVRHLRGESSIDETFHPNPNKRQLIALPNGASGYYRPRDCG